MFVEGIGVVCAGGRGRAAYEEALRGGGSKVTMLDVPFYEGEFPVMQIPEEALKDKALARSMRRADRFSRMAVLGAQDALNDAGVELLAGEKTGIILATALGPHRTTFKFLDDIREFGDDQGSPTIFSHSVHNAAASYLAKLLKLEGPAFTVTDFFFGFQQALLLGKAWLAEGRCDRVLVGGLDELGTVMEYVCSRKLRVSPDGVLSPWACSKESCAVPGEGCLFLLLGNDPSKGRARVESVDFGHNIAPSLVADGVLIEADGLIGDESVYASALGLAACSPVIGSILCGGGFHCAAAVSMLGEPAVVPGERLLARPFDAAGISTLQTVRFDCRGRWSAVALSRV